MQEALSKYIRVADYLSAIQIYFKGNLALEKSLSSYDENWDTRVSSSCFIVQGYEKSGSTTTTFDMVIRNCFYRWYLAFIIAEDQGVVIAANAKLWRKMFESGLANRREYIIAHGDDPIEITNWSWQSRS